MTAEIDNRSPAELRRIAFHEAGHVTVAVLLGRYVHAANIHVDGRFGGVVYFDPPLDPAGKMAGMAKTPRWLAGTEATVRWRISLLKGTPAKLPGLRRGA